MPSRHKRGSVLPLDHCQDIIGAMKEIYVAWDGHQHLRYCTPNFFRHTGYSEEEFPTLVLQQIVAPEDFERVSRYYTEQASGRGEDARCTFQLQGKNQKKMWVEMTTRIVRTQDGSAVEFRGIARDITILKETEDMLRQREERVKCLFHKFRNAGTDAVEATEPDKAPSMSLQELSSEIIATLDLFEQQIYHVLKFSSLASHELRTPLAVLRIQMEHALQEETSAEAMRENIAAVYDEILSLNGTVNDLLDLSQLIAGTFRLKTQPLNIRTFLQEFYDEGGLLARSKDISLVLQLVPDAIVDADPLKLRQIFFNLLDNAIKNTPEKGKIHLSAHLLNHSVVIQIEDNGKGISEEEMEKIFDPFFKGADANSHTSAGLGMTLVKSLIEAHQGRLTLQSKLGQGTTISITLPLYQE